MFVYELEWTTELCYGCVLPQGKSSPRPSPSCLTRSRPAIERPTVKPPPIPVYSAGQKKPPPQIPPVAAAQRQYSPQAYTPPSFKSTPLTEQRRNQAPPPPSGPPPLPPLDPKTHSRHSAAPSKPLPDPPKRPPPPCPGSKPSVVNIFCIFLLKDKANCAQVNWMWNVWLFYVGTATKERPTGYHECPAKRKKCFGSICWTEKAKQVIHLVAFSNVNLLYANVLITSHFLCFF